jgi:hypothetical protein
MLIASVNETLLDLSTDIGSGYAVAEILAKVLKEAAGS